MTSASYVFGGYAVTAVVIALYVWWLLRRAQP